MDFVLCEVAESGADLLWHDGEHFVSHVRHSGRTVLSVGPVFGEDRRASVLKKGIVVKEDRLRDCELGLLHVVWREAQEKIAQSPAFEIKSHT